MSAAKLVLGEQRHSGAGATTQQTTTAMFKIIGTDGRQYGPVPAETIREWITHGRANGETMAQIEGGTEWKPLAQFTEFAESLAQFPPPPTPSAGGAPMLTGPPVVAPPDPQSLADEILQRGYEVRIGDCFSRGWQTLTANFWPVVGISALVTIALSAAHSVSVGIFLQGPLLGGLFHYYLKLIRGEKAELADAFAGFNVTFGPLLLVSLVSLLLMFVGYLLCVLPGIYLSVAWILAVPLAMQKRLTFWDAMEVSRRIVSHHWWQFFGLLILSALLNLAGTLACCVGAFVTGPLTGLALMHSFDDIFRERPQTVT